MQIECKSPANGQFNPQGMIPEYHLIINSVGQSGGLEALKKRKISSAYR